MDLDNVRPWTAPVGGSGSGLVELERKLFDCERTGKYKDALKVQEDIRLFKEKQKRKEVYEAKKKNEELANYLVKQERGALRVLKRQWKVKFTAFQNETETHEKELKTQHMEKEQELRDTMIQEVASRPIKFSPTVLQLRDQEMGLVKNQEYAEADILKKEIEILTQTERRMLAQQYEKEIETAVRVLKERNERIRQVYLDKRAHRELKMKDQYQKSVQKIKGQFELARKNIKHSRHLRENIRLRTVAKRKTDIAVANVMDLVASLENDNNLSHVRSATAIPQGRPKSRGLFNQEKSKKNKKTGKPGEDGNCCNECSESLNPELIYSIPKDYIRPNRAGILPRGIGSFCSWECAEKWNSSNSPTQQKWVRHLFIMDAIKREKKEKRMQEKSSN